MLNVSSSFLFSNEWSSIVQIHYSLIIHSPVDGRVGCFQFRGYDEQCCYQRARISHLSGLFLSISLGWRTFGSGPFWASSLHTADSGTPGLCNSMTLSLIIKLLIYLYLCACVLLASFLRRVQTNTTCHLNFNS